MQGKEHCLPKKKKSLTGKIEFDPRIPADRIDHTLDQLKQIKEKLKQFGFVSACFILSDSENIQDECDNLDIFEVEVSKANEAVPILFQKVHQYLQSGFIDQEKFLDELSVSDDEVDNIEKLIQS